MTAPADRSQHGPITSYLRLYNDEDGESHFEEVDFPLQELDGPLPTPVMATPFEEATHHGLRIVPPGWERDWAPASRRMIAIYLSGEGEIQASDGEIRRLLPGMMLLAEDTTGRGHRVRHIGTEPVTVVHIALPETPIIG